MKSKTKVQIIKETNDYLVINKPAGLIVHSGGNLHEKTLVDWLISFYPKIKNIGDDPIRPGLVHRLDKEVSGLMVIAKNQKSFKDLKNQFKNRTIHKEYTALVYGQVSKDSGLIDFSIARSRLGYKMAALPANAAEIANKKNLQNRDQGNIDSWLKSRTALTTFIVKQRFVNYTLLRVNIKTGRTHQIRVHFFALGHPLVGDNLYSTRKTKAKNKKLKLGRIFLVADHLSFDNLQGEKQKFSLPLPQELLNLMPKH